MEIMPLEDRGSLPFTGVVSKKHPADRVTLLSGLNISSAKVFSPEVKISLNRPEDIKTHLCLLFEQPFIILPRTEVIHNKTDFTFSNTPQGSIRTFRQIVFLQKTRKQSVRY
jgi:hypothetical protein